MNDHVKEFIQTLSSGNMDISSDMFNYIMAQKVTNALDNLKQEVSSNLFGGSEEALQTETE